jgi:NAD(P)H-flavin reductase
MASFTVKILERQWLSSEILELCCEKPFNFLPGQYVFVEYAGQKYPFSIASAPCESHLRFHMQHSQRRPMQAQLWQHIAEDSRLNLSSPLGQAYLRQDSNRPLLFIAGGSGFAPISSMIHTLARQHSERPIYLYWGVEQYSFFYDLKTLPQWQNTLAHFKSTLVLSHEEMKGTRHGLVHRIVLEDQLPLESFDIYIAGPFALSKTAQLDFNTHYNQSLQIYSDALTE